MKFLTSKTWTRDNLTTFFKKTSERDFCSLRKKTYAMLFFENSTRTHYSFNKAVQDLGGEVLDFNSSSSSLNKGESFYDTVKTFEAFGVDGIVIRSSIKEYWNELKDIRVPIINAGDGSGSHPSQALLDMYTVYKEKGQIENQKILIIGDIKHSRVAKTNIDVWRKVGSHVDITGPKEFKIDDPNWIDEFDSKLDQYDVVMLLRIQKERLETEYNDENYNKKFGLNADRLKKMKKDALIMHPGPFNRGVELTDDVLNDERCKIWDQVRNGVEVRKMIITITEEKHD
ncbi:aspartate carbamoyltransferase catalytic subunit [Mycoplasma todarodis]|uniref:Aspartate carbamoyltransferase n=1 Tax=Mycoplasma todarodis TaxID=1937191 RepID=A0A4R0XLN9_9MOLU|nr:aspartate carbamoyltransferase catalytic subunit [Mycoplasma todarodis]TCG11394.1 aspartate carbamoyltransferase [Mycoplasma todarodis]